MENADTKFLISKLTEALLSKITRMKARAGKEKAAAMRGFCGG
jgi:hypothetical protein